MNSQDPLPPRAELAAAARALSMEVQRRKRWGTKRIAALEQPQDAPHAGAPPEHKATPAKTLGAPSHAVRAAAQPPASTVRPAPPSSPEQRQPVSQAVSSAPPSPAPPSATEAPIYPDIPTLRQAVAACSACSLGAAPGRSGAIVGRGTARPKLLFITDHIGPAEKTAGKPLDLEAGQLLMKITTAGMGLKVEEVHTTPAVKCALPPGCVPSPKETASCRSWLAQEVRLMAPLCIVTLGAGAAHALFGKTEPGSSLQGRLLKYDGIPAVAIAHPRNMVARPELKRSAWADLQRLLPLLKD